MAEALPVRRALPSAELPPALSRAEGVLVFRLDAAPESGVPHDPVELLPARLVFRSGGSRRVADARGGAEPAHALYQAGSYSLDLSLSRERGPAMVLVGQIADHSGPGARLNPIRVSLESCRGQAAWDMCNPFGEFCLRYRGEERLRLRVPVDGRRAIEVPLPTARPRLRSCGAGEERPEEIELSTCEAEETAKETR